jgi:hypothetical protein
LIGGIVWIVLPAKEVTGELQPEPVMRHSDRRA